MPRENAVRLANYVCGTWTFGLDSGEPLLDPVLGNELAFASSTGIDYAHALRFGRDVGGPALRRLTYLERAGLLSRIADVLAANRDAYYEISLENSGAPKGDAAIDVDGAIYTLRYYAREG